MVSILRATTDDAAVILAIQKRAFAEEARRCGDWEIPPLTESLEAVAGHIDTATVLIARVGEQVVGSVRGLVADNVCTIRGLSVERGFEGQGIGAALLGAIEQAHPDAAHFDLLTNNATASNVHFYQRRGYRILDLQQYSEQITLAHMGKAGRTEPGLSVDQRCFSS
jgi:ribosomal protein S18 acetylase RimI-like enzyme